MRVRSASLFRLLIFWALTILLQWFAGTYHSELAPESDEPGHIVTGLMVRDYATEGWGRSPLEFAHDYYLHYPKVAIGHWPPMFYIEQAAWTLLFPSTRTSLLVMMALQVALLGMLLWPGLEKAYGSLAAWLGCFVLITLPGLHAQSLTVMTEVPMALLIGAGMLCWGRYLDSGRAWYAAGFGLFSAAAILSKGTGVVMAGVPLLSVLLAGRVQLMRRLSFWCPVPIVLVVCAPWYLLAPDATQQRVGAYGGVRLETHRIAFPLTPWTWEFGWIVPIFLAIGLAGVLYRRKFQSTPGILASAVALAIAATIFPIFVSAWEPRHLVEASAAFLLIAAAGVWEIAGWPLLRTITPQQRRMGLIVACVAVVGWSVAQGPHQQPLGYRQLAQSITHSSLRPARSIVVSGDSIAEGALISEMAQIERHPQRYVLRATKLFAKIDWMGHVSEIKVSDAAQMEAFLMATPIDLVVVDHNHPAPYAYQTTLEQVLVQHPEQWQKVAEDTAMPGLAVFRHVQEWNVSSAELDAQMKAVVPDPIH